MLKASMHHLFDSPLNKRFLVPENKILKQELNKCLVQAAIECCTRPYKNMTDQHLRLPYSVQLQHFEDSVTFNA